MYSTKKNPFGVMDMPLSDVKGMELRYEVEEHSSSDPAYLRQMVFRDKSGNYFLYAKGGAQAHLGLENYCPHNGREVLIPFTPEALLDWAQLNLAGEEYACALEEFKGGDASRAKKVWQYQNEVKMGHPGHVCEFLVKTDINGYILFSTDASYPYFARSTTWIDRDEDGSPYVRDDLYMYHVTPETARRWAKLRGMDEHTCQTVFER